MKKYAEPDRLRLVGKAWEIRHALRQEKKNRDCRLPVSELLADLLKKQRNGEG
ncbi:Z-ring formation inhibitor MciZ [Cohnella suwonensis]|uniref:Z-ring formation inhibitor MciZ n=1 Tax=Cohnella suwonensis TaxID=696072 RepID=A0ABW0LPM9_9BACL